MAQGDTPPTKTAASVFGSLNAKVRRVFLRWIELGLLLLAALLIRVAVDQPPPVGQERVIRGPVEIIRVEAKSVEFVVGSTTLSVLNDQPGSTGFRRRLKVGAVVEGTAWNSWPRGERYSVLDMSVDGVRVVSRSSSVGYHRFGSGLCLVGAAGLISIAVALFRQARSVWDVYRAVEKKKRDDAARAQRGKRDQGIRARAQRRRERRAGELSSSTDRH